MYITQSENNELVVVPNEVLPLAVWPGSNRVEHPAAGSPKWPIQTSSHGGSVPRANGDDCELNRAEAHVLNVDTAELRMEACKVGQVDGDGRRRKNDATGEILLSKLDAA